MLWHQTHMILVILFSFVSSGGRSQVKRSSIMILVALQVFTLLNSWWVWEIIFMNWVIAFFGLAWHRLYIRYVSDACLCRSNSFLASRWLLLLLLLYSPVNSKLWVFFIVDGYLLGDISLLIIPWSHCFSSSCHLQGRVWLNLFGAICVLGLSLSLLFVLFNKVVVLSNRCTWFGRRCLCRHLVFRVWSKWF